MIDSSIKGSPFLRRNWMHVRQSLFVELNIEVVCRHGCSTGRNAPGQTRGTGIEGGVGHRLTQGDVITIPAVEGNLENRLGRLLRGELRQQLTPMADVVFRR